MKLTYRDFKGMRPALDSRLLNKVEAIDARDCDLKYHTVKPFLAPDLTTLSGEDREPLGYLTAGYSDGVGTPIAHIHDILHNVAGRLPTGFMKCATGGHVSRPPS